jgi:hypothetical protein
MFDVKLNNNTPCPLEREKIWVCDFANASWCYWSIFFIIKFNVLVQVSYLVFTISHFWLVVNTERVWMRKLFWVWVIYLKFRFLEILVLRMLNLVHLKIFIGTIKCIFLNENWSWSMVFFFFFLHNFLFWVQTKFQSVMHMYLKNSQSQSCTFMHKTIVFKFLGAVEWFLKSRFNTCKWQFV